MTEYNKHMHPNVIFVSLKIIYWRNYSENIADQTINFTALKYVRTPVSIHSNSGFWSSVDSVF